MRPARAYAEVAVRRVWADLLLRIGLRERAADAYDGALIRAFALASEFEPPAPDQPRTSTTGAGYNQILTFPPRWEVKP